MRNIGSENSNLSDGYKIVDDFIDRNTLKSMSQEIDSYSLPPRRGGFRNAEKLFPSVKNLSESELINSFANQYLFGQPRLIRALVFSKTEENNWLVPWHQDKTVAVSRKFKDENWRAWSIKDNVHHVQPPTSVMEQIITFRIHLNNADKSNGCLKVVPKSHNLGTLTEKEVREIVSNQPEIYCEASERSVLMMRPLLLHSSEKAKMSSQRRVLHLEYSSYQLPLGITWGQE